MTVTAAVVVRSNSDSDSLIRSREGESHNKRGTTGEGACNEATLATGVVGLVEQEIYVYLLMLAANSYMPRLVGILILPNPTRRGLALCRNFDFCQILSRAVWFVHSRFVGILIFAKS